MNLRFDVGGVILKLNKEINVSTLVVDADWGLQDVINRHGMENAARLYFPRYSAEENSFSVEHRAVSNVRAAKVFFISKCWERRANMIRDTLQATWGIPATQVPTASGNSNCK